MSVDLLKSLIREIITEEKEQKDDSEDDVGRPVSDPDNKLRKWADDHENGHETIMRVADVGQAEKNKYMRGEVVPPLPVAVKLKKLTNIPVEYWAGS